MIRGIQIGLVCALLTSFGCGSGDGSLPPVEAESEARRSAMAEVGEMLVFAKNERGKAPAKAADLAKYAPGLPTGYERVKDGDVVVVWGAPMQEGASDKVIAYEKAAPESGGYVLMQDGTTVRQMTAEEFKAAPKAGG